MAVARAKPDRVVARVDRVEPADVEDAGLRITAPHRLICPARAVNQVIRRVRLRANKVRLGIKVSGKTLNLAEGVDQMLPRAG